MLFAARAHALVVLLCGPPIVAAAFDPAAVERCASIADDQTRLACFDAAVRNASAPQPTPEPPRTRQATRHADVDLRRPSLLEERWSIGARDRDGRFDFRAHRPSYFLGMRGSDAPNTLPSSPTRPEPAAPLDVRSIEAKYQLSFKLRLADFGERWNLALWAGYTQQSQWQVYNAATSRPFRETNYEPELMLALHPDQPLLGWRWRLLVIGFAHQSNGRDGNFSRSWNRIYAQFGFDHGNFGLLIRPWWRIPESGSDDDNPDITRYLGHGDIVGVYRYGDHSLSLLGRYNMDSGKGGWQFNWTFPLVKHVRGYVQVFSGYGESLIDYNVRQNTLGIGISLSDFL